MDVLKGIYSIMEDAIPQGCGYSPRCSLHVSLVMRPLIRLTPISLPPISMYFSWIKLEYFLQLPLTTKSTNLLFF